MKLAIICSLILSILHSILFYEQELGISVFLFTTVALFFFLTILHRQGKIKNKKALLLSIPIILLSITYFIFNNHFFNIMNIIAMLFLFSIMTISAITGKIKLQKLIDNLFIIFFGPLEEIDNSIKEISKNFIIKDENKQKTNHYIAKQIIKSILISLPILIIVLTLLSTADEAFASIFSNIFDIINSFISIPSIFNLICRIIIIILLTLYLIGFLLKILNNKLDNTETKNKDIIKIQGIMLSTLLTLLNTIYLIFAGVQVMHIIEQMQNPSITNYASYARNGFFQLMAVSIINFVIILITKNNKKENTESLKKYIKIMNVTLAIFTTIILISSILRMRLYEQEYGYTFLRIMVYWLQITELILIIPVIIYILKEKFKIFNYFLVITTTMYVIINFINIDYIIAKGNIDRFFVNKETKRDIDFEYLQECTSTDAIPQIIRLLDTNDKKLKEKVNIYLTDIYNSVELQNNSWQSFNYSRKRALKKLEKIDLQLNYEDNSGIYTIPLNELSF